MKTKMCAVCKKEIPKGTGFDSPNDHRNWRVTDKDRKLNIRISPYQKQENGKAQLVDVCKPCMQDILKESLLSNMADKL